MKRGIKRADAHLIPRFFTAPYFCNISPIHWYLIKEEE